MRTFLICPECELQGKRSTVRPSAVINTDKLAFEEFYDETGRLHQHDPNQYGRHYDCSNGHNWNDYWKNLCWCQQEKK